MNAKKCKKLRKMARAVVASRPAGDYPTRYVFVGDKFWKGKHYSTHKIVDPQCFRGIYHNLKRSA